MELAGRRALVTGGGRGIGNACARALTKAGAEVTVLGRDVVTLREACDAGDAAAWLAADVTDAHAVALSLAGVTFDILVNNAGAAQSASFPRTDRALWDRMLALNLTAAYEVTRCLLPGMAARGWGRVVNIASTAGLTGYPYVSAYVAAKHGLVGLTRALAVEYAKTGVTVNAVCPGYTDTDMLRQSVVTVAAKTDREPDDVRATFTERNPQGRLVQTEEVAAAALFLCGPHSGAMNGQAITVAGGEVM